MKTLLEDRDVQSAVDTYADDATLTLYDQGGLVVRKDQTEAWFENALNSPETITWSMDAVAVRGDLLCLIRHHRYPDSGFGTDSLNVLEIDPDGLARRFARFQNEDLRQAHDWLNQWWIEGLPPELAPVASAVVRIAHLIEDGDRMNRPGNVACSNL